MGPRGWAGFAVSSLGVGVPCYLVEKLTNFYFLNGNQLYGTFSGLRIEIFIIVVVVALILSGAISGSFAYSSIGCLSGVLAFLSLAYVFCDPRVCYSTGIDGLEPLRLALFLTSAGVAACSVGVSSRGAEPSTLAEFLASDFALFFSIGYYPVIFTFAGTRILAPFDPWAVGLLLFFLCLLTAASLTARLGRALGLCASLVYGAVLFLVSGDIATAYLSSILVPVAVMLASSVAGMVAGTSAPLGRGGTVSRSFAHSRRPFLALILLVFVMTLVIIPDAAVGLAPQPGARAGSDYEMAVPVYAGAYMDASLGSTKGVSVTISYAGTDFSTVGADNFLAAGILAHSPGCCVDGIDYGYGAQVFAFHGGGAALVASAWEVCDDNAACGGHSWKVLMFEDVANLNTTSFPTSLDLAMVWKAHTVYWEYSFGGPPSENLTLYSPPPAEKPYFNTGYLPGGPTSNIQSGNYFVQFGVSSRYPLGSGEWKVTFSCPSTLQGDDWGCLGHVGTLQGGQSFWKALWRWGENYPNISATPIGSEDTVRFAYSNHTMTSFATLW